MPIVMAEMGGRDKEDPRSLWARHPGLPATFQTNESPCLKQKVESAQGLTPKVIALISTHATCMCTPEPTHIPEHTRILQEVAGTEGTHHVLLYILK